jgi:hypothetical protein
LYATSTMDLRSRYIKKFARVPLHLNYKLLDLNHLCLYLALISAAEQSKELLQEARW